MIEPQSKFNYWVYITTNPKKTVLYTGVTNDLERRMSEHIRDNMNDKKSFAGKYFCYNLIYFEYYSYIADAIAREKEIKNWTRAKKEVLINSVNPNWHFLNDDIKSQTIAEKLKSIELGDILPSNNTFPKPK